MMQHIVDIAAGPLCRLQFEQISFAEIDLILNFRCFLVCRSEVVDPSDPLPLLQ